MPFDNRSSTPRANLRQALFRHHPDAGAETPLRAAIISPGGAPEAAAQSRAARGQPQGLGDAAEPRVRYNLAPSCLKTESLRRPYAMRAAST